MKAGTGWRRCRRSHVGLSLSVDQLQSGDRSRSELDVVSVGQWSQQNLVETSLRPEPVW
jgi:hypothetical protein